MPLKPSTANALRSATTRVDVSAATAPNSGQVLTATGTTAATWQTPSGGSVSATTKDINQTTHGLAVGDVVKYSGSAYAKAQADSATNAEVVGIVSVVADANNFTLLTEGYISTLSGLTANTTYFLSASSAGALTATEPSTTGQVSKPLLRAVSTTAGYFFNFRGSVIGSLDFLTVYPLPNYATTGVAGTGPTFNVNTTASVTQMKVDYAITVNKISFEVSTLTVAGTMKIGIFSEDGQTRHCNETTGTISAGGLYTHTMSAALALPRGIYYLVLVPVSTTDLVWRGYALTAAVATLLKDIASEPVSLGTLTVTAGTLPSTFTPSSVTSSTSNILPAMRFDN